MDSNSCIAFVSLTINYNYPWLFRIGWRWFLCGSIWFRLLDLDAKFPSRMVRNLDSNRLFLLGHRIHHSSTKWLEFQWKTIITRVLFRGKRMRKKLLEIGTAQESVRFEQHPPYLEAQNGPGRSLWYPAVSSAKHSSNAAHSVGHICTKPIFQANICGDRIWIIMRSN